MTNLTNQALTTIQGYKTNSIIMSFVTNEALEKVASELRAKLGGGTTAKGVELLAIRHANINDRVEEYIKSGLVGCYLAVQH